MQQLPQPQAQAKYAKCSCAFEVACTRHVSQKCSSSCCSTAMGANAFHINSSQLMSCNRPIRRHAALNCPPVPNTHILHCRSCKVMLLLQYCSTQPYAQYSRQQMSLVHLWACCAQLLHPAHPTTSDTVSPVELQYSCSTAYNPYTHSHQQMSLVHLDMLRTTAPPPPKSNTHILHYHPCRVDNTPAVLLNYPCTHTLTSTDVTGPSVGMLRTTAPPRTSHTVSPAASPVDDTSRLSLGPTKTAALMVLGAPGSSTGAASGRSTSNRRSSFS
jgi:hypothetical protein